MSTEVRDAIDHTCSPGICHGQPAWDAQLCADINGCLELDPPTATKLPATAPETK